MPRGTNRRDSMAECCTPVRCGPGYASPAEAMKAPRELLLYTVALYIGTGIQKPDYLATIDADPNSPTYRSCPGSAAPTSTLSTARPTPRNQDDLRVRVIQVVEGGAAARAAARQSSDWKNGCAPAGQNKV